MKTGRLVGAVVACFVIVGGQCGGTAQAGSSLPSGATLLARMQVAMQHAGSVTATIRTGGQLASNPGGQVREVETGSLAVSTRERRLHLVIHKIVTTSGAHPVVVRTRFDTIGVDGELAQRAGRTGWSCRPVAPADQSQIYSYTLFPAAEPLRIATLGAATVRGISVWQVRIVSDPRHTTLGPQTLSIAQDTYRLVRESVVTGVKGATPGPIKLLVDYSHFDQSVRVSLPATSGCSAL